MDTYQRISTCQPKTNLCCNMKEEIFEMNRKQYSQISGKVRTRRKARGKMLEGAICLCISLIVLSPFFCVSIDHYNTVVALAKEYEVPENEQMLEFDLKDVSPMIPEYFGDMLDDIDQMPKVEEPEPIVDPDPEPQLEEEPEPVVTQQAPAKSYVAQPAELEIRYEEPCSIEYTEEELDLLYAITGQECSTDYDGALAAITTAFNRGDDPLEEYKKEGQFCYTIDDNWQERLNGNTEEYVKQAVHDALDGKRNHNYTSFRAKGHADGVLIGDNVYF